MNWRRWAIQTVFMAIATLIAFRLVVDPSGNFLAQAIVSVVCSMLVQLVLVGLDGKWVRR